MRESSARTTARLAALLAALAVISFGGVAAAGDGAAAAEVLFAEGKRLAQAGSFAAACPKFEESQRLDPGLGTLYRLADCYERVGRTASAWAAFVEVAGSAKTAGQRARADDASKRASELEPSLARLVIRVVEPDQAGLVIKRGDVAVGRAQWSTPMPVDPGEVAVEASAPGKETWRGSVATTARAVSQLEVPPLRDAKTPAPPATDGSPARPTDARPSSFGAQRTVAVIAGAAGVVGLGIGSAFGLISLSKKGDAGAHCDPSNACDSDGLALRRDALAAGDLSTVGFVAGGALAATAIVLWVTAPAPATRAGAATPRSTSRLGVTPRWGGLTVHMELP
jgi:hypothetical protein